MSLAAVPSQTPPVEPHAGGFRLQAGAHWRCVDFISDLHLHAGDVDTFTAWRQYMSDTPADAVMILGDWFEVWVGDDALEIPSASSQGDTLSLEQHCARICQHTAKRAALYVMHGNRDFLIGSTWLQACAAQALPDPTLLALPSGQTLLLSHGDALCLADTDYQRFRTQVRSGAWQQDFLAKPLAQRQAIARGLREQSSQRKQQGLSWADVDANAATELLRQHQCATLVHGHTHLPAEHALGDGLRRVVLSDWDLRAPLPRAQVLRWHASAPDALNRIDLARTDAPGSHSAPAAA